MVCLILILSPVLLPALRYTLIIALTALSFRRHFEGSGYQIPKSSHIAARACDARYICWIAVLQQVRVSSRAILQQEGPEHGISSYVVCVYRLAPPRQMDMNSRAPVRWGIGVGFFLSFFL